ncbi:tRNA Selenocysteine associated protein isoform X2 [Lycorma delicatula]|uniref:tRNA Selenocysteine associated protein isoform X2 n=1 Tax=Lycorma delicatula TaxID=130591 RepID=UPI003F517B28
MTNNLPSTCQLWMGGLEHYMTENFIMSAFHKMSEKPAAIKVMRNRYTGEPAGYAFIHFPNEEEAKAVMHKLNGKIIPNSTPPQRFRLNTTNSTGKLTPSDREYSVWVGDLSADVDDYSLYRTFASRYQSIRTAKVITDSSGFCKGFGFIRFGQEDEQKHCLTHMNGFKGLGSKLLKVSLASPKSHRLPNSTSLSGGYSSSQDYSSDPKQGSDLKVGCEKSPELTYWQSYMAWQSYDENCLGTLNSKLPPEVFPQVIDLTGSHEDDLELIEHNTKLDIESSNREITQRDYNLWDALECSKWMPVDYFE